MATPSSYSLPQLNANALTSSELLAIYENAAEDVRSEVTKRFGRNQLGLQELFSQMGMTKQVATGNVYSHFEEDYRDEIIRVTASYTSLAATATFTVDSNYNYSYPPAGQTIYTSSTTSYAATPRVGDVLELGSSAIHVIVTAVSEGATSTFDVETMQTGDVIPAGLATEEIFTIGRAEAEGGSTPENREIRDIKYENKLHTIAEGYKSTGTAMLQEALVESDGSAKYYYRGILNTRFRFEDTCDAIIFTGKKITSTSATYSGTNSTEGLIPFIRNYGNEEGYTAGSWSLQDLENMSLAIGTNLGAAENMMVTSQPLQIEVDNILRTSEGLKAGGVSYDKMADFGFNAVTYGGVHYYFKTLRAFSNKKNFGSANSQYKNMGLVIPMTDVTAFDLGGEKISTPACVLRYGNVDGEDMGYKEWITGGAGRAATDRTDTEVINMRKRVGFEAFAPNRFGIFVGS